MISQVITQVLFRSKIPVRNGVAIINRWIVVKRNLEFLSTPVIVAIITIGFVLAIAFMIKNRNKEIEFKENFKKCIPYIVIFFLPIIWFVSITQHSYTHAFFVYRILIISIISLLLIIYKMFEGKKEEEK